MRYRNAWMLTFTLLAVACKPTAPVAEAAVAEAASTQPAAAESAARLTAADTAVAAGFSKDMPYATLRGTLTEAGWLPLRDPECRDNVGGTARVCGELPEVESCSGDGHCVMHFANADAGKRISVTTYGPYERWNMPGEQVAFAVQSWEISPLSAMTTTADKTAAACPSRDFDAFLKSFASDDRLRRAFTAPVVKVAELGGGEDGDDTVFTYTAMSDYKDFNVEFAGNTFHFVDGNGTRDTSPLELKIQTQGDHVRLVRYLYGMSEGNSYKFENTGDCWYLTEDPEPPSP